MYTKLDICFYLIIISWGRVTIGDGDGDEGAEDVEAGEGGDEGDEGVEGERQGDEDDDDDDIELHCRVEEQKEVIDGLKDEVCGKTAQKGHAGLCK